MKRRALFAAAIAVAVLGAVACTVPPPQSSDAARARALLQSVVPAAWQRTTNVDIRVISGSVSLSYPSPPRIELGRNHFVTTAKLRFVVTHEWAHQIAFTYGDAAAGHGYPPAGFDSGGQNPAEKWAHCVAEVLTGDFVPAHGLTRCSENGKAFVRAFLAAGPPW